VRFFALSLMTLLTGRPVVVAQARRIAERREVASEVLDRSMPAVYWDLSSTTTCR
jgi:hypothetical protein